MITDNTNQQLATDAEGYLIEPVDWDDVAATQLAHAEWIELSEERWQIIRFMRNYNDEHQMAADARFVIKHLDRDHGYGKRVLELFFKLFLYGYVKQACKIAGMKRPLGCITTLAIVISTDRKRRW